MTAVETTVPLFKVFMAPEASERVKTVLESGFITQGPVVEAFEAEMRAYLDNDHVLTTNSATSATHIAIHLLKRAHGAWPGLEPDDEVLTTALTCTATNFPILANGLRIKWVDVDPATANISIVDLARKLSPKTKIITFVHWGGNPVDLDAIREVQELAYTRFGFRPMVIEDCAHAMGATWKGKPVGCAEYGNICTFSLQAIKHLTAGDGGLLCLPNANLYERAKLARWYGIDREKRNFKGKDFRLESDVTEYGFKMHMNDISASIASSNFPYLEKNLAIIRENAQFYLDQLDDVNGVELLDIHESAASAHWIFSFYIENKEEFIIFMKSKGIVASQVHARNDTHTVCAPFRTHLPNLDRIEKKFVSIPVGWWVTPADRERVVSCIREFCSSLSIPRSVSQRKILITGGCGFIGHHVVEHFAKTTDCNIVVIDKLSYASLGYDRLRDTGVMERVKAFACDLVQPIPEGIIYELGNKIDFIVHMAAETHVDNSIADPVPFIRNNVDSTISILEYTRKLKQQGCDLKAFFYFSTDEVFGPALGSTLFEEWDRHKPTNPYSSSKSAAENICIAYENTYKIPLMIVNVMNAFGERQHPEKFIPKCIRKVMKGEKVHIHSYPDKKRAGTRFYIHARNIAAAVQFLLNNGSIGEKYNITGEREVDNLELAQFIAEVCGKPLEYEMVNHHETRPGHDLRYGLDGTKMSKMGWKLPLGFKESLRNTITWTLANPQWLNLKKWADDPESAAYASDSESV